MHSPTWGNRSIPERVFDWVGPAITRAANKEVIAPSPPQWSPLEGTYRSMWADLYIMSLDGKLVMLDPNEPDPKATAFTLEPVKDRDHTFRIADGPDKQLVGEDMVFEFAEDGHTVTGSVSGSARLRRVQ